MPANQRPAAFSVFPHQQLQLALPCPYSMFVHVRSQPCPYSPESKCAWRPWHSRRPFPALPVRPRAPAAATPAPPLRTDSMPGLRMRACVRRHYRLNQPTCTQLVLTSLGLTVLHHFPCTNTLPLEPGHGAAHANVIASQKGPPKRTPVPISATAARWKLSALFSCRTHQLVPPIPPSNPSTAFSRGLRP